MDGIFTPESMLAFLRLDARFRAGKPVFKVGSAGRVALAADVTSYTLHTLTTNKTAWLVGIMIYNAGTADGNLGVGTGATGSFTQALPNIGPIIQATHELIPLFPHEFTAAITVQSLTTGFGNAATFAIGYFYEIG